MSSRNNSLTSLLRLGVLLVGVCVALAPAFAQDASSGGEKTKKTVAMSQQVFEKLTEAQQLIEAKQYSKGHAILKDLRGRPKLSVYEAAQIWNLTAYAYYLQERYKDSINAYEQVLKQGEIPEAIVQSTLKTLSQLVFHGRGLPQGARDREAPHGGGPGSERRCVHAARPGALSAQGLQVRRQADLDRDSRSTARRARSRGRTGCCCCACATTS